jgi:VWFA-related protein
MLIRAGAKKVCYYNKISKLKAKAQIFFLFSTLFLFFFTSLHSNQDKPLQYKVSVDVKSIPVFVLDSKGNPVLDLRREEIELYLNGKKQDIVYFNRYDIDARIITKEENTGQKKKDRVVFLIIDSMFNSNTGFRRSLKIAKKLATEGKPEDLFILFENNPISGLKHVHGPDQASDKLLKKIKKLRRPIEKWATQLHSNRELNNNIDFSLFTETRLETNAWESLRQLILNSERLRYKFLLQRFSDTMSNLQYILKTIDTPKLVFLISEGIASNAFKTEDTAMEYVVPSNSVLVEDEKIADDEKQYYSPFLFKYLKKIVKSINYGGSVIHVINPRRLNDTNDDGLSGEMSLRYLARESGGQYFAGSDTDNVVKRIIKTSSSFYQMVFYINTKEDQDFKIDIKCKRRGVIVKTILYADSNRNYQQMDKVQKKMFALNIIKGGNWSRNQGKIMRIGYKKGTNKDKNAFTLHVPLPNQMKNKKLDMFLITLDEKNQRIGMEIVSKTAKDWINLKINYKKNKKQFFVIIEPRGTYCIYNSISG